MVISCFKIFSLGIIKIFVLVIWSIFGIGHLTHLVSLPQFCKNYWLIYTMMVTDMQLLWKPTWTVWSWDTCHLICKQWIPSKQVWNNSVLFFALSLLSGILCFWCNMTIYDDYYDYSLGLYFAAVRPNMDSYVFLRVNEDTDGVLVEEETLDTG